MSEEYESYLREQIEHIRRDYERAIAPLLEALYRLRAMKPPPPIFINLLSLPPEQRKFIEENLK